MEMLNNVWFWFLGQWYTFTEVLFIPSVVLVAVGVPTLVYVWMKKNLPIIARKEHPKLFCTVKKGRTILIETAGKIKGGADGYYSNLSDLNKYADRVTGEILAGKDDKLENSFWWKYFGVIWMGLGGSIHEYPFEKTDIVNSKIIPIKANAGSIWIKNSLVVQVKVKSKELYDIEFDLQIILETIHSGLSINYNDFNGFIVGKVKSACRDFCAETEVREISEQQLEKGKGLFECIMSLNTKTGNESLEIQVGQKITDVSMISPVRISEDEIKIALESGKVAEEKMKGEIKTAESAAAVMEKMATANLEKTKKEAEGKLITSQREAEGIKAVGDAKNDILEKTAKLLTKKGAEELEKARVLSYAIEKHNGTLVLGDTGVLLGDTGGKK